MKHKILSKALSLTAAAAIAYSAVGGSGSLTVAAEQLRQSDPLPVTAQQPDTLVPVIVKVAGDAVLAHPAAENACADFLESDLAKQIESECSAVQQSVQNSIRQLYPELNISFSYTTLYNGFSCELPEILLNQVRALPDVISVVKADAIEIPQMNRAKALSGFPAYYDMTGCSGEGQVVAVIDSELDTTHPMFAPLADGIETAISREDIAEIAGSGTLHVNVDPERAYISSKLPFVIDYVDDQYDGVPNHFNYHGTHVSGIAAGNAFTDGDGTEFSGIAKDAQLIFFATSTSTGGISLQASIAAIEDAIRLHADVINMSWGAINEYFGNNPLSDVLTAADQAGIVICSSAGNADNGTQSYGITRTPEALNYGMISDKAELGSPVFLVASADNTGLSEAGMFLFGGEKIVYRPMMNESGSIIYLTDTIAPGDYEYVYCGKGMINELQEMDLEGKIMLIDRGYHDFPSMAGLAEQFHALGVIVIDKEYPDGLDYARCIYNSPALAVITYQEGQMMCEAEQKVITVTGEKVMRDYPTQVSSYTSWGVKESLDLRPDIMGIGGRVRSAGYGSAVETMSGTSMSSPYVTGCVAVIREYLRQQGMELTGSEFSAYIRRLLMNAAIPYEEDGNFVTPRRQGAGLVSLDRAVSAKVLMSGETGDAKVNLFDKLGSSFRFNVTLTNNSPEDVTFSDAGLRLTTDGFHYDDDLKCNVLYSQQALGSTTDFSGPVTVAAGQSQTVTVQVDLDAAQYASLKETFKYGFFIEGYLMLSGAANSADVSIPVFGFSDDWAQFPMAQNDKIGTGVLFGRNVFNGGCTLVEANEIWKSISARIPEGRESDLALNPEKYMTDEEIKILEYGRDEAWISPNGDGIADVATGISLNITRWVKAAVQLLDADGNVLYEDQQDEVYSSIPNVTHFGLGYANNFDESKLPEGDYTFVVKTYTDYPGSAEAPQEFRSTFHVDKTPPTANAHLVEESGRIYLDIYAKDDKGLQGVVVMGIGKGGLKGVYNPKAEPKNTWKDIAMQTMGWRYAPYTNYPADGYLATLSQKALGSLPTVLRRLGSIDSYDEGEGFNFQDTIPPYLDEFGSFHQIYDVTDFEKYSFTVMDNAYNFVEFRSIEDSAEKLLQTNGVWQDMSQGLFEIDNGKMTFANYYDASVSEYTCEAEKDTLTLKADGKTRTFNVRYLANDKYRLVEEDADCVYSLKYEPNTAHYQDIMPPHSVVELIDLAIADSEAFWSTEPFIEEGWEFAGKTYKPELMSYHIGAPSSILINLTFGKNKGGNDITEQYAVSLFHGRGSAFYSSAEAGKWSFYSRAVNLFEKPLTTVPAGLYFSKSHNQYMLFDDDGKSGTFLYCGGSNDLRLPGGDIPFSYKIEDEGRCTFSFNGYDLEGGIYQGGSEDGIYFKIDYEQENFPFSLIRYDMELELITNDPEKIAKLRSSEELTALGKAFEQAVSGKEPHTCQLYGNWNGKATFQVDDEDYSDWINIDLITLKGTDSEDNPFDLLNPPKLPENARSLAEIEETAIASLLGSTVREISEASVKIISDKLVQAKIYGDDYDFYTCWRIDPVTGFAADENGNLFELFPSDQYKRGDVNCDGARDVADAVLLARYLAEDQDAVITEKGQLNADCNTSGAPDQNDVVLILKAIARLIRF